MKKTLREQLVDAAVVIGDLELVQHLKTCKHNRKNFNARLNWFKQNGVI